MSLQIPDQCVYQGDRYLLLRIAGAGFFEPKALGLDPYHTTNACWRGYMFIYLCEAEQLFLNHIFVNNRDPPKIQGVKPEPFTGLFAFWYRNLRLKERGTGHLLIGLGQADTKLRGRLYPLPIDYGRILRISVEKGDITSVTDHSDWAGKSGRS